MQDEMSERQYSRRTMLRAAGLLAGAAIAGPLAASGQGGRAQAAAAESVRVGTLLPSSTVYAGLAEQFAAGLALAFGGAATTVQLVMQPIGAGYGTVRRQAEALLKENVGVVVGLLTPSMAARTADLFQSHDALLLASSVGENVAEGKANGAVFDHSLQQSAANWALGKWAAQTLGRRAVMAADFHSSGYDSLNMFRAGFAAGGGKVVDTVVTHGPQQAADVKYLLSRVAALRPDFVYAAYCGSAASELVQAYGGGSRPPLIGNGFVTDEALLAGMGNAAMGIKSAHAWSGQLDTAANRAFQTAYATAYGQAASSVALLGYESGLLLAAALKGSGGRTQAGPLGAALAATTIASPRGTVTMAGDSHSSSGPIYLREVAMVDGAAVNAVRGQLQLPTAMSKSAEARSGWLQAYLSV